jgi:hypothetical protein
VAASQFNLPGETLSEGRKRACFILKLIDQHIGETVLICSHGDLYMMTGSVLCIDIDTATAFHFITLVQRVRMRGNHWKVVALNRITTDCE